MSEKENIVNVTGFRVKKYESVEGKNDKDPGKIKIILEADKDCIRTSGDAVGKYHVGDIVSTLNMHQTALEPVIVQLRFEDE